MKFLENRLALHGIYFVSLFFNFNLFLKTIIGNEKSTKERKLKKDFNNGKGKK